MRLSGRPRCVSIEVNGSGRRLARDERIRRAKRRGEAVAGLTHGRSHGRDFLSDAMPYI
jgi:hypothetical protein